MIANTSKPLRPLVSESLHSFLHARKTPANADLVERWSIDMEVQLNVIAADGEPVAGRKSTWSNGSDTWHSIRIPRNAATAPTWEDYRIGYPFDLYAEGIGMTGWDWKARRSRHFGYDFDALTGHAQGIEEKELEKVKQAACALPYVEVRRSTGGGGIHLYVYIDEAGVPTANHTEHAALARCILGMMSAEDHGLEIIKPATKRLSEADLPANWRDHIEVVKGQSNREPRASETPGKPDEWDALCTAYYPFRHPDHDRILDALRERSWVCIWDAQHECWQTHAAGLKEVFAALGLRGAFDTLSTGRDKATPNCYLFYRPDGAFLVKRFANPRETSNWTPDKNGHPSCMFNSEPTEPVEPAAEPAKPAEPVEPTTPADPIKSLPVKVLTAEQLAAERCSIDYLIDGIWAARDPGVWGGHKKCLKTTIVLAFLLSLASGLPFLGRFIVNTVCSVLMLSGESGLGVLKETLERICKSMGIALSDVKNFHLSEWLPSLDSAKSLAILEKIIDATGCKVIVLDPLYLCVGPNVDPANLFAMGALLRPITELCRQRGISLILLHHLRKKGKNDHAFDVPELDDLSWSGTPEYARQWVLLARRESYEPGSGEHKLWLSSGGSAGHSNLFALDIDEGPSGEPRRWDVSLSSPADAREAKKLNSKRERLIGAARNFPSGATKTALVTEAGLKNDSAINNVIAALVRDGVFLACKVTTNSTSYDGYRLLHPQYEEVVTHVCPR